MGANIAKRTYLGKDRAQSICPGPLFIGRANNQQTVGFMANLILSGPSSNCYTHETMLPLTK